MITTDIQSKLRLRNALVVLAMSFLAGAASAQDGTSVTTKPSIASVQIHSDTGEIVITAPT